MCAHKLPTISVITPSYNQGEFLEYAIQSVLKQDYPNIEYILVDGGSQDKSLEVIQRYASHFAWWVSEPDGGQADAINKGLKHASGEVIAWLNSDDLYLPGAICGAVKALQGNPEAGMVYADAITIDESGYPLKLLRFPDWGLEQFMSFRIICQPAVFMRRAVLEQAGWLDERFNYLLDHHLWLRMASQASVVHVSAFWAAARHHAGAKNVHQAEGFAEEALRLVAWMQTQPNLFVRFERNRRQVLAGAYRLRGRYLLEAGMAAQALRSYWRAMNYSPAYALRHWHRILYALFSLMGAERVARLYTHLKRRRRPSLTALPALEGWCGLRLS